MENGEKNIHRYEKKVFSFPFALGEKLKKRKKWEAKKDRGVKPVYLKKKLKVRKQLLPANFSWSGFQYIPEFLTIA